MGFSGKQTGETTDEKTTPSFPQVSTRTSAPLAGLQPAAFLFNLLPHRLNLATLFLYMNAFLMHALHFPLV